MIAFSFRFFPSRCKRLRRPRPRPTRCLRLRLRLLPRLLLLLLLRLLLLLFPASASDAPSPTVLQLDAALQTAQKLQPSVIPSAGDDRSGGPGVPPTNRDRGSFRK